MLGDDFDCEPCVLENGEGFVVARAKSTPLLLVGCSKASGIPQSFDIDDDNRCNCMYC